MPAGRRGPGWHLPVARTGGHAMLARTRWPARKPSPSSGLPGQAGTLELSERQGQACCSIAINLDLNARPITSYGACVIVFARSDRRCRPMHLRLYPREQHQPRALPAADRRDRRGPLTPVDL